MKRVKLPFILGTFLIALACTDDSPGRTSATDETTGDGDGDPTGDGDGAPGDGDGAPGDGDGAPGDGDGAPGDGDGAPGDGDGAPEPFCGDGVVNGDEQCDDGNDVDGDDCTNACTTAVCGDGVLHEGIEMCDDGNDVEDDGCNSRCMAGFCGDGIMQEGEGCDDGNDDNTDDCAGCQPASCGDGFIWADNEECDDGNDVDTDDCLTSCVAASCGDGVVWADNEECDDGNDLDTDACLSTCVNASCGDGFIQEDVEVCDGDNLDGLTCEALSFSGGTLACLDDCSDLDDSMCIFDPCDGQGFFYNGFCWIIANSCVNASTSCAAAGFSGTNGQQNVAWDAATHQAVADGLGVINGGDQGCCATAAWFNPGNNQLYTHNYGPNFSNWSGCLNTNHRPLHACVP